MMLFLAGLNNPDSLCAHGQRAKIYEKPEGCSGAAVGFGHLRVPVIVLQSFDTRFMLIYRRTLLESGRCCSGVRMIERTAFRCCYSVRITGSHQRCIDVDFLFPIEIVYEVCYGILMSMLPYLLNVRETSTYTDLC